MKIVFRAAALCALAMSLPVHAETLYGSSNGSWILETDLGAPGSVGDFSNNDLRIFTFDNGAEAANLTDFQIVGNTIYGLANGNRILQAGLGAPGDVIDFSTDDMRIFTFDTGDEAANLTDFQIIGNTIYGLANGNRILQAGLGAPGDVIDFSTDDMRIFTFDSGAEAANMNAFQISEDVPPAVPEPATWSLMIAGFALAGAAMRRRQHAVRVIWPSAGPALIGRA